MAEYPTNAEVAEVLERVADLLEAQDANSFRVRAYRRAAGVIGQLDKPVSELIRKNTGKAPEDLPNIGSSLDGSVREFVHTGRLGLLDRLEGQVSPEALELAAHDGRLMDVPGIGERKSKGIRDALDAILSRSSRRRARRLRRLETTEHCENKPSAPTVGDILQVDREYREKAAAGDLKTIAPKRFNPEGESWLPIYHTERSGWNFTALYSNTARAHDLGKTEDWVVVYFERDGHENQSTVVTEYKGPMAGKRVIRGRERECLEYYRSQE